MKRWTVVVMMAAAALGLQASEASATWYHYIYGSAAEQGIYMWQAGCGSDGCEHHDCYEGVCYNRWGDYGWRGSGKVNGADFECGIGPSEGVWCGIIHHTCRQPEPYNWAGFTDTHTFLIYSSGTQDSGVLACAVGRCNGPDTAPDCGATSGGCTDRYWRYGATCSDGSCWNTYCSGWCGGVSWAAYWWDDGGGGGGGGGDDPPPYEN